MQTFWGLVEDTAGSRPDDPVVSDDHGRTLTVADLRDEAERAAAGLAALGIGPGDVVSWQVPTTLEAAVILVACARLGAVQNPIIPILREREVGLIAQQVKPKLTIVPSTWRGFDHAAMARSLGLETLALDLEGDIGPAPRLPAGDPSSLPPPPTDADACRWIYYSSGTTADPKGARHADRTVIAASNGIIEQLGFRRGDVYPIAWPFTHIGGVSMLGGVLRAGGSLPLFDTFDPTETPVRMAAHNPTILGSATPFFLAYCAAQRAHGDEPLYPALRICVSGGAPLPQEVTREIREVLGLPGALNAWGLTEFPVATGECTDDDELGSTVGRPSSGVEIQVVDGELRLKGPQCFLGYVDAARDADAFDGDGWFRTGDLGSVRDDGRVVIEGRLKDVIIRNAENISALEIEDAVLRHPAVADVAVVGLPHPRTGEMVCAVVVVEPGAEAPTVADLARHCQALGLAKYKCPEDVRMVDALPRTPMGKVVKTQVVKEITA